MIGVNGVDGGEGMGVLSAEALGEEEAWVAARMGEFDPAGAFEEIWWPDIERDWREERWPTFKDMARHLFLMGYRDAVMDDYHRHAEG